MTSTYNELTLKRAKMVIKADQDKDKKITEADRGIVMSGIW